MAKQIVAVAADGDHVSMHFGHCEHFLVYTIQDQQLKDCTKLKNPGHKPGFLPKLIAQTGATTVIVAGIGASAIKLFTERNIEVIVGQRGLANTVVDNYINKRLSAATNACHQFD